MEKVLFHVSCTKNISGSIHAEDEDEDKGNTTQGVFRNWMERRGERSRMDGFIFINIKTERQRFGKAAACGLIFQVCFF